MLWLLRADTRKQQMQTCQSPSFMNAGLGGRLLRECAAKSDISPRQRRNTREQRQCIAKPRGQSGSSSEASWERRQAADRAHPRPRPRPTPSSPPPSGMSLAFPKPLFCAA